ncbi:MAG: NCS2 family permease [Proteobacteria bacterium]|nr:NCS2 family permease [Pseudomonadota bacterium]MBI3495811.1 NCS2 family permease [Pseudomonadota bacterium]
MLEQLFDLKANRTDTRTEVVAGMTTFLTMAYIIFVNPLILADAGMDRGAVFVATCLAAAIGSAAMAFIANYPIALAPGMGLNAYFTYGVVKGMGHSWEIALGAVFLSGVLFFIISATPIREWIIDSIPRSLKLAISAGIGLFLGIIALENAGIITAHPVTLVTLAPLDSSKVLLAVLGFVLMIALDHRGVPGAIIIAILAVSAVAMVLGLTPWGGIVSIPPSIAPTLFKMDIAGALNLGLVSIVFVFLFVDLFDNTGTLIGVAQRAGLLDKDGRLPRIGRALLCDSGAAMAGALLGTSTTTSYIESAAGVKAGGRTGLTALVVAVLFLASLFIAPLAGSIPAFATAPALLFVACMMSASLRDLDWEDVTEYVPAMVTVITMPLSFSIAHGIAFGFISYVAIKLLAGRLGDIKPAIAILAVLFVVKFVWLGGAG